MNTDGENDLLGIHEWCVNEKGCILREILTYKKELIKYWILKGNQYIEYNKILFL